jgi:hypothetical protein
MTYKETLFFVAKCLTISLEEKNRKEIELTLKTTTIDWDSVVKVSTAQYVFPALYCNLKRVGFLHYVPADLVAYMKHITDLNRERNQQIIAQAKEINNLLLTNNITPIFLKGTGNLLEGLYEDIGERMVGDIDLLFKEEEYKNTVKLLKRHGYINKINKFDKAKGGRHYPRLINEERIAAVEVHFRMLNNPFNRHFNYNMIKDHIIRLKNSAHILGYKDQILLTCYNIQANDFGYWLKVFSLRKSYDLFLLSKKHNTLKAVESSLYYFHLLNTFLASTSHLFKNVSSIHFKKNKKASTYIKRQMKLLENPKKMNTNLKFWNTYFLYKSRVKKLNFLIFNKEVRNDFFNT